MKLVELTNAGRTPELPLSITLDKDNDLVIENLLRTLPNQRYVAKANWQAKIVLAKLFVGSKANKHYQRELKGVNLLAQQQINTPKLFAHQITEEGGYLLFEYLENSQTLDQQWQLFINQPLLNEQQKKVLQQALAAIAQLHLKGLWQQDLHLDNLLEQSGILYWIDGDGISVEKAGQALSINKVIANLAVFFAQLPPQLDDFLQEFVEFYQTQNITISLSVADLQQAIIKVRKWRVDNILKKIRRDCTLFSVKNTANGFYGVVRTEEEILAPLLAEPDYYIDQGRFIKGFGTTNVADIIINGKHILLKRYNIKNFKHKLSRCWRPTRGWHSWQESFRLMMLGIPTAKPLALLEERHCWMRGRAWLVTEYLEGPDLLTHLKPYENSRPPEAELVALDNLFVSLIKHRISHGDLKGTNLFWVNNQWTLIDLDAVKQHKCIHSFKRAYAKDRTRFLRNWPKDSSLYRLFDERLPKI
ncbi:serine/threonine protein kinase [Entomomonas sp. E2T0]|uniref:lipopolysaccharide kinase InaA family protein n=1 Tax=Entomomonas sp. E2T0 TaxID=2930213 RepID=UPI0022284F10|nr:lipopolysaccharide kinase InaA family protein [Entomomonas sp. E2T0]UYZ84433.1 serine/threonine protein kinase [Entomomonas sp. E2T0]